MLDEIINYVQSLQQQVEVRTQPKHLVMLLGQIMKTLIVTIWYHFSSCP